MYMIFQFATMAHSSVHQGFKNGNYRKYIFTDQRITDRRMFRCSNCYARLLLSRLLSLLFRNWWFIISLSSPTMKYFSLNWSIRLFEFLLFILLIWVTILEFESRQAVLKKILKHWNLRVLHFSSRKRSNDGLVSKSWQKTYQMSFVRFIEIFCLISSAPT